MKGILKAMGIVCLSTMIVDRISMAMVLATKAVEDTGTMTLDAYCEAADETTVMEMTELWRHPVEVTKRFVNAWKTACTVAE